MTTENSTETKINWDRLAKDVLFRIRLLAAADQRVKGPSEVIDALRRDAIIPNVQILAEFCENVRVEAVDDNGDSGDEDDADTGDDEDDEDDDEGGGDWYEDPDEDDDEDDDDDEAPSDTLDKEALINTLDKGYHIAIELMEHLRDTQKLDFGQAMLGISVALALGAIRGNLSRDEILNALGHVIDVVGAVDARIAADEKQEA